MTEGKAPLRFKKIKAVTRPQLKLTAGIEYHIKFEAPVHQGERLQDDRDAAFLANVVNLDTGEEMQIVCPSVFRKELDRTYPGESYVGKCFAFELMRVPEKRYNMLKSFIEISVEETATGASERQTLTAADVGRMPASVLNAKGGRK